MRRINRPSSAPPHGHLYRNVPRQGALEPRCDHVVGRRAVGPRYREPCGGCEVPPWEACGCSALLLIIESPQKETRGQLPLQMEEFADA